MGGGDHFAKEIPTLRAPASLSRARAVASDPAVLDRYFDLLHKVLTIK